MRSAVTGGLRDVVCMHDQIQKHGLDDEIPWRGERSLDVLSSHTCIRLCQLRACNRACRRYHLHKEPRRRGIKFLSNCLSGPYECPSSRQEMRKAIYL